MYQNVKESDKLMHLLIVLTFEIILGAEMIINNVK
jgi:hypothetical protein